MTLKVSKLTNEGTEILRVDFFAGLLVKSIPHDFGRNALHGFSTTS
jgi:hypothetical protein